MDDKVYWSIVRRLLDGRNHRLGTFKVDVSRDGKTEKAALLLTMNHCDDSGVVLLFNCPDRLGTS